MTEYHDAQGRPHRIDGPAVELAANLYAWYHYGLLHRTNGPAAEYPSGTRYWYIHGNNITDQVETWLAQSNITYPFDHLTQAEFILRFSP